MPNILTAWSAVTRLFIRGMLGFLLVLGSAVVAGWCLFPYLGWPGRLIVIGYLALILAGVVLRGTVYTVWLIGIITVITPAALLLLAQVFAADVNDRKGIIGLLYLYGAGMVGGLVLELLQDKRYVLEKPCLDPGPIDPDPSDPDPTGDRAVQRPGPKWNLGFLSRLLTGGLAGVSLVTLIGSLVGNLDITRATQPSALVWAVVAGSAAPAVWKRLNDAVVKRSDSLNELLAALEARANRAPTTSANGHTPPPQQPQRRPPPRLRVPRRRSWRETPLRQEWSGQSNV